MTEPLRLTLLGPPGVYAGEAAVACASKKAFALFAFLALDRRRHSRRELATLFWGRRDEEAARGSLRATLFRLPRPLASCVAIERDSLSVIDSAPLSCDATRLEALAATDDVTGLRDAAALYRGPLLQDFDADATPEFDDWLYRERVRVKQVAYDVFDRVIAGYYAQRTAPDREAAILVAQRWLALEPAAERAHRWLMRIYLDAGRSESALAQYEVCQRALAVVEGKTPGAETRSLIESVEPASSIAARAPQPAAAVEAKAPHAAFASSVAATSFVGRVEEVAQLLQMLADPACRLVTLHGLGGVGKTRLAHAVATQTVGRFPQGSTWIALEAVARPDAVADALALALGLVPGPGSHTQDRIVARLRAETRLIVLDNFEHLLTEGAGNAAVDLVLAILREAPDVRIIVTSRDVLGVQEEWVYGIEGLSHSVGEQGAERVSERLAAVDLFAQRARQAYLGFSLAAEMPHVLAICRQVDGLPLAIELAAAWVRTIPCAEIARELAQGIDVPSQPKRNRPERHHSLRSVMDFSWGLLTAEQQEVLEACSEFRGGFSREAASHVAGATLRVLSALVDKALVRRMADGRFSLHPLVRKYAAERLARSRNRQAKVRSRHSEHYLRLLFDQRRPLYGSQPMRAREQLATELDNIRAAWESAVARADTRALADALPALRLMLDRLGLYEESVRTIDHALAAIPRADAAESRALLIALLVGATHARWRYGDASAAETCLARLRAAIGDHAGPVEVADLEKLSGLIDRDRGNLDAALLHLEAAARAAEATGDAITQSTIANEIGVVHFRRGAFASARDAFSASARKLEDVDNQFDIPLAVHNIAYCDLELGRFDQADEGFERALRIFRQHGDARGEAMVLSSLGILARRRGELARARELAFASRALAERMGNRAGVADATDDLAQAVEGLGDIDEARRLYDEALAMARELGQAHLQCAVLLHLARAHARVHAVAASARCLREALDLASRHDFQTARLLGILGASGLCLQSGDAEAKRIAARWSLAVLAIAESEVDIREAVPDGVAEMLSREQCLPSEEVDIGTTLVECRRFLDALVAHGEGGSGIACTFVGRSD